MAMPLPSSRLTFALIAFGCAALMGIALYMQHVLNLEPCPLCMTQRIFVMLVGATAFIAFLTNPGLAGRRVFASLTAVFATLGGGFSSRQLWLQSLPPDQVPACGPSLEYMFETFPFLDAVKVMLHGDGNCAEVTWTFLSISIAGWTLVAFIGLLGFAVWQLLRRDK